MRTEHKLFLVLRITPKSRAKVCAQWRMSLKGNITIVCVHSISATCLFLHTILRNFKHHFALISISHRSFRAGFFMTSDDFVLFSA